MTSTPEFAFQQMLEDPTPGGIICHRIVFELYKLSEETTLSREQRQRLFRILLLIGKKLVAVWQHLHRFTKEQENLVATAKDPPKNDLVRDKYTSQALFLEFDGFLMQVKSALDYLVHLPRVIVGTSWNVATFGKGGKTVLRALERNIPNQYKVGAEGIAEQIRKHHLQWLSIVVDARDRLNHLLDGDVSFEDFSVAYNRKTNEVHVPRWTADMTYLKFMETIWGEPPPAH